jgi:hypothetical protein
LCLSHGINLPPLWQLVYSKEKWQRRKLFSGSFVPTRNAGVRRCEARFYAIPRPPLREPEPMKFVEPSPFADPDVAARKLVEIANAVEVVQDGRIYIELVNGAFLEAGGTPAPLSPARFLKAGCGGTRAAPTSSSPKVVRRCLLEQRPGWPAPTPQA